MSRLKIFSVPVCAPLVPEVLDLGEEPLQDDALPIALSEILAVLEMVVGAGRGAPFLVALGVAGFHLLAPRGPNLEHGAFEGVAAGGAAGAAEGPTAPAGGQGVRQPVCKRCCQYLSAGTWCAAWGGRAHTASILGLGPRPARGG